MSDYGMPGLVHLQILDIDASTHPVIDLVKIAKQWKMVQKYDKSRERWDRLRTYQNLLLVFPRGCGMQVNNKIFTPILATSIWNAINVPSSTLPTFLLRRSTTSYRCWLYSVWLPSLTSHESSQRLTIHVLTINGLFPKYVNYYLKDNFTDQEDSSVTEWANTIKF